MNRFQFSMTDLNHIIVAEAENGKTQPQLVAYLQKRGWPPAAAQRFVMNALRMSSAADMAVAAPQPAKPAKSQGPSVASVAAWLTALSALLWALVDVAGRLSP